MKMKIPDVVYVEPIGYNQGEYYLLPESMRSEPYHHSRIVEALRKENEELKAKLDKARDVLQDYADIDEDCIPMWAHENEDINEMMDLGIRTRTTLEEI